MGKRIGIFGGSFDPIHLGHLLFAEFCREQAALDEVRFIPAAQAPHKGEACAESRQRLEMTRLATLGHAAFVVDACELERGGKSYTVETLEGIAEREPENELFLIMGADSLRDFPKWRAPERIVQLATLLVVRRGGESDPPWDAVRELLGDAGVEAARALSVGFPAIELSSRSIRERIRSGKSIRYQVPRAVEEFIRQSGLYR